MAGVAINALRIAVSISLFISVLRKGLRT